MPSGLAKRRRWANLFALRCWAHFAGSVKSSTAMDPAIFGGEGFIRSCQSPTAAPAVIAGIGSPPSLGCYPYFLAPGLTETGGAATIHLRAAPELFAGHHRQIAGISRVHSRYLSCSLACILSLSGGGQRAFPDCRPIEHRSPAYRPWWRQGRCCCTGCPAQVDARQFHRSVSLRLRRQANPG